MQNIEFPWSDNWWIEKNEAWFCGGNIGALFCVDMNNGQGEFVAKIPECDIINCRLYSYCIKYKNTIFCLPNMGTCIWCYDVKKSIWEKIEVRNEVQLLVCMNAYRKDFGRIWLLETDTGNIFEVNLEKKVIEKEYHIPPNGNLGVGEYVLVGRKLYCPNGYKIYVINIDDGEIDTYEVSEAKEELYTICFDGVNFWLSGVCKEVYVWNPIQGIIKTIADFPKEFGFYYFRKGEIPIKDCNSFYSAEFVFFDTSISLGKYIWYIPYRADEIVYIDRETYEVKLLEVEGESETLESINTHLMAHKYMIEYVRDNRYIGIFSVKNRWIFEIDTIELCVRNREYKLDDKSFITIAKSIVKYDKDKILREKKEIELMLFSAMLNQDTKKTKENCQDVGTHIYHMLEKTEG